METIITPIKTLHGTNPESLQQDYITAMNKISEAVDAIHKVEFNARDYQDMDTFFWAKKQRNDQLKKLSDIYDYLETIAIALN